MPHLGFEVGQIGSTHDLETGEARAVADFEKGDALSSPSATVAGRLNGTWHEQVGYGRIDCEAALDYLLPRMCPQIEGLVPQDVIDAALADPDSVAGYGELMNPNLPFHPLTNTYRVWLSLRNLGVPYDPLNNTLIFKAGCP